MKIWSTIVDLSIIEGRDTCYRVCREISKITNQTWMVKRKVAPSLDEMVYECYDIISSCKESNLVFFTHGFNFCESGWFDKLEYIISVCSVFNKKFIMPSGDPETNEFVMSKGGIILNGCRYDEVADEIINLHSHKK